MLVYHPKWKENPAKIDVTVIQIHGSVLSLGSDGYIEIFIYSFVLFILEQLTKVRFCIGKVLVTYNMVKSFELPSGKGGGPF